MSYWNDNPISLWLPERTLKQLGSITLRNIENYMLMRLNHNYIYASTIVNSIVCMFWLSVCLTNLFDIFFTETLTVIMNQNDIFHPKSFQLWKIQQISQSRTLANFSPTFFHSFFRLNHIIQIRSKTILLNVDAHVQSSLWKKLSFDFEIWSSLFVLLFPSLNTRHI